MGEGLDCATYGHEYTVAIEAHLLTDEAILRDNLLNHVNQRVLAHASDSEAEQKQRQKEFLHPSQLTRLKRFPESIIKIELRERKIWCNLS